MLKNKPLVIGVGVAGLIVIGALVWWLASPLFVSRTVEEEFPFDLPSQEEIAAMTTDELQELETNLEATLPSPEELDQMPEEARQVLEDQMMQVAAALPTEPVEDQMPAEAQPVAVRQGQFVDADDFHRGSGSATIYQLPDGSYLLRLEDFEVTNGPDLHVLLASNPRPTSSADKGEYIDLGQLKGNVGNQNYEIPAGTDISQYQSVVIYCMPFRVVFSTATLS